MSIDAELPATPIPGRFPSSGKFEEEARAALIAEIKETADKLDRDQASRGDLKILSRALKELRYAFKVFTPFRHVKKATVFGSARTPPDHPDFQASVQLRKSWPKPVKKPVNCHPHHDHPVS